VSPQPPPGVEPQVRNAARVVLLDERDRILLFRWEDERLLDVRSVWITPGGGLNAGESPEAGARRELREETGIDAALGPCVWIRSHTFRFGSGWIEQRERFYLVRVADVDVNTDGLEPQERIAMVEHRLWSLDDIAASADWFAPRRLADLLQPILRGDLPTQPIEIGA
jgi:ADP-ribose pyrophosphatase YjhB (NUDIX family)